MNFGKKNVHAKLRRKKKHGSLGLYIKFWGSVLGQLNHFPPKMFYVEALERNKLFFLNIKTEYLR